MRFPDYLPGRLHKRMVTGTVHKRMDFIDPTSEVRTPFDLKPGSWIQFTDPGVRRRDGSQILSHKARVMHLAGMLQFDNGAQALIDSLAKDQFATIVSVPST